MSCFQYSENYMWLTSFNLGKGAFGMVYQGVNKETGEEVAVKTFKSRHPSEIHMREFDVMKVLSHDNIVKLIAIEEEVHSKNKVLIMELCRGGNLQTILDEPQNAFGLEESEFLSVLKDLSTGLKYLRDNNIIHRDLKPANIMKYKTDDGCIIYKLADFGSARYLEDDQQYQSLHGTEEYLHPNLYKTVFRKNEGKAFQATTDLWSVGVTIYQMATSSLPFKPFGGRRNKETMLYILNHKESGVISGVQHGLSQPIVWSKELPETCLLNKGLKDLITALLVNILECDHKKMWTFDKFFDYITDIISRKIFHVFHINEMKEISLYMHPHKKLQDLQNEIFTHTQVQPSSQLLLFDKSRFLSHIDPSSNVSDFPVTSLDNPLILFHMENPELKYLAPLEVVPSFPMFSDALISKEVDASIAKTIGIKAYAAKRLIIKLIRHQELLLQISKIQISVSSETLSKLSSEFEILRFRADAGSYMFELLKKTASVISPFITEDCGNHDSNIRTIHNSICEKVTKEKESLNRIKIELAELVPTFYKMKQQIVISKSLERDNRKMFKQPSHDKCVELASTLVQKICDSSQVFTRHLHMRVLSIQDHHFHMLERVKMQDTCRKLLNLQNEVLIAHKRSSKNLSDWYSGFQAIMIQCHCLEMSFYPLKNHVARSSSSLPQLESELFELIKRITDDDSFAGSRCNGLKHPKLVPVINGNEDQHKDTYAKLHTLNKVHQDLRQSIEEMKHVTERSENCFQLLREDIEKLQEISAEKLSH